jgi:predicted ATPase
MLNRLHIENFTVFRKVDFDFVPGINVLVGANATGKTHVMKLLYAIQKARFENEDVQKTLLAVFSPLNLNSLIRGSDGKSSTVQTSWNGRNYEFTIRDMTLHGAAVRREQGEWENITRPVFIPVKDMLAHSIGFLSLYDQRNIDFDATHRDILSLAFTPTLREPAHDDMEALLGILSEQLEGSVEVQGERFYLTGKNGRFEMHLVAEGWRKLALLYQLIANGSLQKGSVLYWDEPETNLNPSLMDEVINVLLELARRGIQIFLSTHDYIILKELDLQKQAGDSLRMFAMERNKKDGAVIVHPADTYIELSPNLIAAQFERIYDLEVERALGS